MAGEVGLETASDARFRISYPVAILVIAILAILLFVFVYARAVEDRRLEDALTWGLLAAIATGVGTLPILSSMRFSQRANDAMLGFGAGVMLAACSFSLVIPSINAATAQGIGLWGAAAITGMGILLGGLALLWLDRALPHEHFIKGVEGSRARKLKRVWMFVAAICLHNFPEGLAIGVAFASSDDVGSRALAVGISIQDIPEGLVVALALVGVGYSRLLAANVAFLSGLIEPLASVLGFVVVGISTILLPWGLAGAAGAMLFVISHEIIPESHRKGHEVVATVGLMLGFVLMMLLDTALG